MKIKYLLSLGIMAVLLSSCGGRYNSAEELTVPILQAIKADNPGKLVKMLPPDDKINSIYAVDKGTVGWVYYNKYTKDYREKHLRGRLYVNFDIIKTISDENKLDWDNVEYSTPQKEDVTDSLSSYTVVTTNLKFPSGGSYVLQYHAANENGKWYLLDDIYFATTAATKEASK